MDKLLEDSDPITLATSVAFVAAPLLYYRITNYFDKSKQHPLAKVLSRQGEQIKPPFPKEVRDLLRTSHLAYLSTVDKSLSSSHLSLMRFTYCHDKEDGEVVIMSTNKQTKKFDMLQQQKGVALLIHDFGSGTETNGQYSITLNGECRIVEDAAKREEYRQLHLQHNPEYPQFIVGDHIAILRVDVKSARICNIHDQVVHWDVTKAPAAENGISTSSNGGAGEPTVLRV